MKEIKAIIYLSRLYPVINALRSREDMPGFTVCEARGFPRGHPTKDSASHGIDAMDSLDMVKVEVVVPDEMVRGVVEAITEAARTGRSRGGDGKIFVYDVAEVVAIHTPARGEDAL